MKLLTLHIDGFDYNARGVARYNGKTAFVSGALPGERVIARISADKKRFLEADAIQILEPAPDRITPACMYYDDCGGCALQHASDVAQHRLKETVWREQITRIGKITPPPLLPAITGDPWHYRSRARLAWDDRRQALGFRSRASARVVNLDRCLTLPSAISARLPDIRALCAQLAQQTTLHGVDISEGDGTTVLRIRLQDAISDRVAAETAARWNEDAAQPWQIWLQSGRDRLNKHPATTPALAYTLPAYDLTLPYAPDDFTQVNKALNRELVAAALTALQVPAGERVFDFFCGLGNFSLPLARSGADVLGFEGVDEMVARATANAAAHGLADRCQFRRADLFAVTPKQLKAWGKAARWLLDPPRAGAQALCEALDAKHAPARIVYVSCNPGTLARDAGILAQKGYRMESARLLHMFAQTAHVESLAVFVRA